MATLAFLYLGTVIVLTGILVVALHKPVYSVIALLVMFFHIAGLFVTLHAEFLAAVQLIVYAGAILVLYLFVVMLLNVKEDNSYQRQFRLGLGLGLLALAEVVYIVSMAGMPEEHVREPAAAVAAAGNTETVGRALYTTYLFPFEVASLILLVAMIGAIFMAKKGIMGPEVPKAVQAGESK
ncbi:MAG TPA: NADH-quinone oxidoreductase subunit J [Nitrospirales bacterium]|nr:NADH-quinone oxidoreductase subunit J [Nitrospirales bacterium]